MVSTVIRFYSILDPIRLTIMEIFSIHSMSHHRSLCALTEGVKDRDKTAIGTLLKSLSYLRENTYHLHRHLWNDVHEDWPFYTEQERQCLKR